MEWTQEKRLKWNAYMRKRRGFTPRVEYARPPVVFEDVQIVQYQLRGEIITIDIADKPLFDFYKWRLIRAVQKGEKYYCITTIKQKTHYLHRLIIQPQKEMVVDHKNGNPLDCTRNNLREVTQAENTKNRH